MKKIKFNILDAFIIVIALCVAFVVITKFIGQGSGTSAILGGQEGYTTTKYVIKVESMRDFTADAILENQDIFVDEPRMHVGKLIRKKVEPAVANQILADGTQAKVPVEDRFDVYLTIEAEGVQKVDGFYVNGNQCLNVGSENTFRVGNVVVYGKIYEIKH